MRWPRVAKGGGKASRLTDGNEGWAGDGRKEGRLTSGGRLRGQPDAMASVELVGVLLVAAAPRKKIIGSAQRQSFSPFRSVLRQAEPLTAHPLQPRRYL